MSENLEPKTEEAPLSETAQMLFRCAAQKLREGFEMNEKDQNDDDHKA